MARDFTAVSEAKQYKTKAIRKLLFQTSWISLYLKRMDWSCHPIQCIKHQNLELGRLYLLLSLAMSLSGIKTLIKR